MSDSSLTEADLIDLMEGAIGREIALLSIRKAAQEIGLDPAGNWSVSEAQGLLDQVAKDEGLVGITARFVKSRLFFTD